MQSFIYHFHERDISNYTEVQTEKNAVSSKNIVQLDSTAITIEFEDIHFEEDDMSNRPIDFGRAAIL